MTHVAEISISPHNRSSERFCEQAVNVTFSGVAFLMYPRLLARTGILNKPWSRMFLLRLLRKLSSTPMKPRRSQARTARLVHKLSSTFKRKHMERMFDVHMVPVSQAVEHVLKCPRPPARSESCNETWNRFMISLFPARWTSGKLAKCFRKNAFFQMVKQMSVFSSS